MAEPNAPEWLMYLGIGACFIIAGIALRQGMIAFLIAMAGAVLVGVGALLLYLGQGQEQGRGF